MKINFVVPVRNGSRRVINKNFRPFLDNKCLLELKIEQLLKVSNPENITINGDPGQANIIAQKYNINFVKRSPSLTNSKAKTDDIAVDIASNYNHSEHLAYVLCNNPFFDFFDEAIDNYQEIIRKKIYSGLLSVTLIKKHLIDINGKPLGFGFGADWIPSEMLNYLFEYNGGIQISKVSEIIKTRSFFGMKPKLVDFGCQSFEIDDLVEFENSIQLLKSKLKLNK